MTTMPSPQPSASALSDELLRKLAYRYDTDTVTIYQIAQDLLASLPAPASSAPIYQMRTIGDRDWMECSDVAYLHARDRPATFEVQMVYRGPAPVSEPLERALHWPDHWDTAAYPDVYAALSEVMATFECSECKPPQAVVAQPVEAWAWEEWADNEDRPAYWKKRYDSEPWWPDWEKGAQPNHTKIRNLHSLTGQSPQAKAGDKS